MMVADRPHSDAMQTVDDLIENIDGLALSLSKIERAIFVAWACEVMEATDHPVKAVAALLEIPEHVVRETVKKARRYLREISSTENG